MSTHIGKTLILEAATQSLSKKMNTEVVFVMALGESGTMRKIREKFCRMGIGRKSSMVKLSFIFCTHVMIISMRKR